MAFWSDFLSKLKLFDFQTSLKTDQAGAVNVKVHNNTYHLHYHDIQAVEKFKAAAITPDFEQAVKEEVDRKLQPLNYILSTLSQAVSGEVVLASTLESAIENIKM